MLYSYIWRKVCLCTRASLTTPSTPSIRRPPGESSAGGANGDALRPGAVGVKGKGNGGGGVRAGGAGAGGGSGGDVRSKMLQVSRGHICDLLSFCVRSHTFRMKYFVLRNNVVSAHARPGPARPGPRECAPVCVLVFSSLAPTALPGWSMKRRPSLWRGDRERDTAFVPKCWDPSKGAPQEQVD